MATETRLPAEEAGGTKLPAEKIPHQNSSSLSLQNSMTSWKKNTVAQQISSAKVHKIKALKNEIFDLQCKLEASSLENHILKKLQYRHLKAIDRYENLGSNLQDLLASHYNEVRTLRKSLRMSQEDERNSSRKLREVEASLVKAKGALQTLHMLSGDKTLAEREELDHRLSVLTEKIEVNDKRIQSLEKQLKLNNSSFSRQLANENRKALEAGIITKTLQMEINSLHQKIKEKDRQLFIKNIYANRMPKIPKGKSDAVPHGKRFSIHRSVQVDKDIFRPLLLSEYEAQETETSPLQLTKEETSPEDKSQKAEVNEVYTDAQCRTQNQSTKKIPEPETFNRTHRDYLQEGRLLMEEHICLEFMKKEKETDLLKQELKEVMKTEQTPLSDSMKENNQEEDAVAEHEKEENKPDKELNTSEQPESNCVISGPRNKTTIRLNKKYIFSEATENLHRGLLTSGTRSKHSRLCKRRQNCSGTAESEVKNSFGLYEPSPGKGTQRRQDSSTEAEAVLI
ncbi:lebercilin-like protein isoform X1 [Pezoporus occidentalis]|uniref:lebercilin-like protein isoform X1 n=2 Tax=Pezoporus occidentalis TaxID=407982 RepID=UPI002F90D1F9